METKEIDVKKECSNIEHRIFTIRGVQVIMDRDIAELYGVETRVLNQAVRRNIKRFPDDFMFALEKDEIENWKSQIVISNSVKMGMRKPPLVFTEQGVAMLSGILYSEYAIEANIKIMRAFVKTRLFLQAEAGKVRVIEIKKRDKMFLVPAGAVFGGHQGRRKDASEGTVNPQHDVLRPCAYSELASPDAEPGTYVVAGVAPAVFSESFLIHGVREPVARPDLTVVGMPAELEVRAMLLRFF